MAHYAFIDENNIVTEVIAGNDETTGDWETYYGNIRGQRCVRTSYNGNIRYNYAGIGFSFDEARDAFIPPKPFESWVLDDTTCLWEAPVVSPGGSYVWDETTRVWVKPDKPFDSWTWDDSVMHWVAPIPMPEDGGVYTWNEVAQSWDPTE